MPTQARELINIVNSDKQIKSSKTQLLTITSGKGGVGKSTFIANFAFLLAKKNKKIAVIDADIGLANMQVLFDLKPQQTFFDYIEGKVELKEVLLQTKYENITLIAGKSGYEYSNHTSSFVFARIVEDIINLNYYDFILVDTGAGLNDYVKEFLSISNHILALTTTDPSALTDVYALMKMLAKEKDSLMICFNHTKSYEIGKTISNSLVNLAKKNRLNDNFAIDYIGNVSNSKNIATTGRLRKLFVKEFENDTISIEMQKALENMLIKIG